MKGIQALQVLEANTKYRFPPPGFVEKETANDE